MSENGNNKSDETPGYTNTLKEMTNFGLLPSTVSTPCSSTTPGPPPFNITQTPFFVGKDPFYVIHPKTLVDMNRNATEFGMIILAHCIYPHNEHNFPIIDTEESLRQQEGYPMVYNNFSIQPNGRKQYTHTTFTTNQQPPQQTQMNVGLNTSTPIRHQKIESAQSPVTLHHTIKPSPSLLQRTNSPNALNLPDTIRTPNRYHQPIETIPTKPFEHHPEGQSIHSNHKHNVLQHTPSFLGDLGVALNRMGINQVTAILIVR